MRKGKANVIIDGQWGSTGKGKLVGYLALRNEIAVATCDFMSNAGHTFVYDNGRKIVVCQLPMSVVNEDCLLCINPGGAITLTKLFEEIEKYNVKTDRLMIHPHTAIITEADCLYERQVLGRISSTLKGCGGSLARKVMRVASLAKDEPRLREFIGDTTGAVHSNLRTGGTVMVEGAQGFDLSLNHGHEYPFVTSRDVTVMSILNNAGIPSFYLGDVYGCIRTFPIRVGNTYDEDGKETGNSGPYYTDQEELTWRAMQIISGATHDLTEKTTVTQKIRRVFTYSPKQINRFIQVNAPTKLFVNFINHVNDGDRGKRMYSELSAKSKSWIQSRMAEQRDAFQGLQDIPEPQISHIGTGEKDSDMVSIVGA